MKLSHLKHIESTLPKLINTDLPIKLSYQLNLLMDDIDKHLIRLKDFRTKFLKRHGERVSDTQVKISKDKIKEFDDGMHELLDEEIDVQPVQIPLSLLLDSDIKLTVLEIEALKNSGFLVDDINTSSTT